MRSFLVAFAAIALVALASAEQVSYRDYKVYKIDVASRDQLELLGHWREVDGVDFWDNAGRRIMIQPALQEKFEAFLNVNKIANELIIPDVEATIEAERRYDLQYRRTKGATSGRATVDFDHFWSTEEIYQYLDELAAEFPNLVKVETVGQTHEGRDIKSVTISTTNGQVSGTKPVIFIDAGVHAREWAAIMSTVYLIHELVEHSDLYANMLQKDWVIVPVGNPDGYEFSRTSNRMWRKNRFPVTILCSGADLNRNFNYMWAASSNACSDTYPGASPESELETQAIVGLMKRYAANLELYLAVHTYGDMILYPFGYAWPFIPVSNAAEHIAMGERARAAVLAVGGPDYVVGNSAEILYTANGASDDYALGEGGFKYGFTLELTGGGRQGFDLPAEELSRVASQTFEIFRSMAGDV
ncbi:carboxypeptidase B [Culex quinquefasciatus]|uniref:carboxypeptidase B n=1 Tax=Culex quinquefasciatus TaxID=7176 RepID=UPI0018E2F09C|nr:carboxypeptidase B [Culex quinquefasciatus]